MLDSPIGVAIRASLNLSAFSDLVEPRRCGFDAQQGGGVAVGQRVELGPILA